MLKHDFEEFGVLLNKTAVLIGRPKPDPEQVSLFFRLMAAYPIETIRAALNDHLRDPQRGRFFPTPADLIAQIKTPDDQWPTSDEAWAIAIRAMDESETIIWTEEMAQAWGICKPIMDVGDEVGARMAFRSSYDRLVASAKSKNVTATWLASLGHDPEKRELAVEQAKKLDRAAAIPHSESIGYEAPLRLENLSASADQEIANEQLSKIRDLLAMKPAIKNRAEADKEKTAEQKKRIIEAVKASQGGSDLGWA